jgi:NitT/TauT family transport system permease protein
VAAEVLCSPKWAAGTMLQTSKAYLDSPGLFAWTIVIVAVSLGMEGLLKGALRSWRGGEGT